MFHFRCDRCPFEQHLDYVPRVYVFDADHEVAMAQRHVWCVRCQAVTPAEALDDPEQDGTWRARRSQPAHCLRCGNQDIEVPDSDWSDLPHPGCGGTLRCSATIVGGTFARCQPHRYSSEGELIETGWRHGMFVGEPDTPLELW